MSPILDAVLSAVGTANDVLDLPGSYFRGAVVGRPGERLSGAQFLKSLGLDTGNETADSILGFGAGFATDPLTFAGGALGRVLGKAIGRSADAAAIARGPGFATAADDVLGSVSGAMKSASPMEQRLAKLLGKPTVAAPENIAAERVNEFLASPYRDKLLAEIPPGSTHLGTGVEGVAWQTPAGDVVRIGRASGGTPGRPVSDGVLQNTRDVRFGDTTGEHWMAERMPKADHVRDHRYWTSPGRTEVDRGGDLLATLDSQGLVVRKSEDHLGNFGTHRGSDVVIDPGAFDVTDAFTGGFQPVVAGREAGPLMSKLLALAGADARLQRSLALGGNSPGLTRDFARAGTVGGALLGLPETAGY